MNDEFRMYLADCGSPEKLIDVILQYHPNWGDVTPIEKIAKSVGIISIESLQTQGFVGALMTDELKSSGAILVKDDLRNTRRRFTIAHELGHFLIPTHTGNKECTLKDLREFIGATNYQRQEAEANRFAAGILMPKRNFIRKMESLGTPEIEHFQILSKKFEVSFEAVANRYIELTEYCCAVIFSKNDRVRYLRRSASFPRLSIAKDDLLPDFCSSVQDHLSSLRVPTQWADINASEWIYNYQHQGLDGLIGQSIQQSNGYRATLLFIEPDGRDDDDEELEENWSLRF